MTDHLSFEQLCDLADGALDHASESAVRAHVDSCDECTSQLGLLSMLESTTASLPREIAPPQDLWRDIRGALKPRRARVLSWRMPQLAAAAVVIAFASSALTAIALRDRTPVPVPPPVAMAEYPASEVTELPARLASDEKRYARSVDELRKTLDERRDSIAPSTIATVERSLAVADSAIAEARDALARDPANRALEKLFASNYERKIDLLRRATLLDPRT